MASAQYAFRSQKSLGVADGPSFEVTSKISGDTANAKAIVYSEDGKWIAYVLANTVQIVSSSSGEAVTIEQPGVVAVTFSPLASTLYSFERPVKSETDVYKNVKAWSIEGELVGGWYQKTENDWAPVITADESHRFQPAGNDILIFSPPLAARPATRLKNEGQIRGLFLSRPAELPEGCTTARSVRPYTEPAMAVWVGERKGAPANLALYPVSSLVGKPASAEKTENRNMPITVARKAFYKADKLNVKWNNAGTMALFLTHTDVDNTGKSYYGETNLYLVALDGSFDGLVDLDKEGPIYDFSWNPTSKDFCVCYGYMPARTQMFDIRAKAVHSFGSAPRNFLSYQPQGRLVLSAGFGNLAGGMDVWEVSTRKKVAEFTASNSSHCEWSPCGRYIMTATLSPRLRVDNGVKIWWCGGQLLHVQNTDDLYAVSFRPGRVQDTPPFPAVVPKAPEANASISLYQPKGGDSNGAASKPVGAYRPPGARGLGASDAYRRDDDAPSSGASTPTFKGGKPAARYIPGAPIPGAAAVPGASAGGEKKKRQRTKNKKADVEGATEAVAKAQIDEKPAAAAAPAANDEDATAKKIRNLTKKLKAIDELKARVAKGEVLEKTQVQKIETEGGVRAEIRALGGDA